MERFAVDISAQIGDFNAPILPVNTFVFSIDTNIEVREVYDKVLEFISQSGVYKGLKVEPVECGLCISGNAMDSNNEIVTRRFYLSGLRRI
jgi:hypothetical protein